VADDVPPDGTGCGEPRHQCGQSVGRQGESVVGEDVGEDVMVEGLVGQGGMAYEKRVDDGHGKLR
jgi:hypothetical protein